MGTSYLLHVGADVATFLQTHLPPHSATHIVTGDAATVIAAVTDATPPIDAVVLGTHLPNPIQLAQQIHQRDATIPIVLLGSSHQVAQLKDVLRFTPLLGYDVQCVSDTDTSEVLATILAAMRAATHRRTYAQQQRVLEQQVAQVAPLAIPVTAYLETLLDAAPIGVITIEAGGRIVTVNRMATMIFQRSERELLGMRFLDVLPSTSGWVLDRAAAPHGNEAALSFSDGTLRWLWLTMAPLLSAAQQGGILILIQDITEQRAADMARSAAQQRISMLAECSLILAASLDDLTVQRFVEWMVAHLADWCMVDVIHADQRVVRGASAAHDSAFHEVLTPLHATPPWSAASPAARAVQERQTIVTLLLPATVLFPVQEDPNQQSLVAGLTLACVVAIPLMAQNKVLGVLMVARTAGNAPYLPEDIQFLEEVGRRVSLHLAQLRLHQEVQDALRSRDGFLRLAAHELKTPLTSVLGYIEVLQRRLRPDEVVTERNYQAFQKLREQTLRLHDLIQGVLDVSQFQQQEVLLQLAQLDLRLVIQHVVDEQRTTLQHTLDVTVPATPILIMGDATRLKQVVRNLLQNGIKYSPTGGLIQVDLREEDGWAVIVVRDEGLGIPLDAQTKIFDRFYRASNVEAAAISGMGIGLAVVKHIVERHGGTLTVVSDEGMGSTFRVALPVQ